MNWFRKHVKTGSRLALFALAIQFALSFGHFHAEIRPRRTGGSGRSWSDAAVQPPSNHDTDRHSTDCAICAVLSLANNFLFATPPLLELPQAVELSNTWPPAPHSRISARPIPRSDPARLPSPDLD